MSYETLDESQPPTSSIWESSNREPQLVSGVLSEGPQRLQMGVQREGGAERRGRREKGMTKSQDTSILSPEP